MRLAKLGIFCGLMAVGVLGSCDKQGATPATDQPEPAQTQQSPSSPPQDDAPAGDVTLHLALESEETAGFCCESGRSGSGTGCRRDDENLESCLREGLYTFECTGQRVDCENGACECGQETGDGMLICCTSIEGPNAHQCTKWPESDYTACVDAGREFAVCAGDKACKKAKGDDSRFDCTCG